MIHRRAAPFRSLNLTVIFVGYFALCGGLYFPATAERGAARQSSQETRVGGVVRDLSGASVAGAVVIARSGAFSASRTTDREGRFVFEKVPAETGTLTVRVPRFSLEERGWNARNEDVTNLEIVVRPAPVSERVTVTATRTETRVDETAASVTALSAEDLSTTAALTLDDALRQVPGFSLFRRSGSRTANPTAQGVSLRGVGASGASRALVLADGVPLNDPFGGWVYWDRVPRASVEGIEIVRGGASNLYGTEAMGGVINLITRKARGAALSFETSYGNEQTPDASLSSSLRVGRWGASLAAEAFHTDGYVLVDPSERGPIDTPAGSEHATANFTLERQVSQQGRAFVRGSVFSEWRENGKPLERNRTHLRQLAAGGDWTSSAWGSLSLRVYGGPQVFDQNFFAVAPDRSSETLTRIQRVPAQQLGMTGQWSRAAGARQTLVGGVESREVRGSSDELVFVSGRLTTGIGAGGRQGTIGLYGEDIIRLTSRWLLTAGVRLDDWRNYDALSTTQPLAKPGPPAVKTYADRTEQAFSPRLSVLSKLTENIAVTASAYRAFRAPTLNELYRSFRLGNILTLANDSLLAEQLTGAEAGASFSTPNRRLVARGTVFWSDIERPIANVTLNLQPTLITRQRENLGSTRSRGIELDLAARLTETLDVSGGYEFADAKVVSFPGNAALEGLLIPQVPRHQLTLQMRYSAPSRVTLGLEARAVGAQFDDDQNLLRLGSFLTADAIVSRPLTHGLEVFAAGENLFNQRYAVGRTPVTTIGPPLLARIGVRLLLRAR